jgi:putative ferrous iron transport protein C
MILSEIKRYLMKHKRVTLADLAIHFDTEPAAMKGMLAQWVRKGRVIESDVQTSCNKACSKCCDASAMEIYEWTHSTVLSAPGDNLAAGMTNLTGAIASGPLALRNGGDNG